MYYFYCPNCKNEKEVSKLPKGTCANPRDGWGRMIFHFKCEKCLNLDAGFMQETDGEDGDKDEEKWYFQSVISMYQNIRGFAES